MELTATEIEQYSRHLLLDEVGKDGQLKLKRSKVLVIGAGGLGCPILQYLTAGGIGKIGIVDNDTVTVSNLQRQILFTQMDIGKNKAETAADRLKLLNPNVQFDVYAVKLSVVNAISLFEGYDMIIDGTDNFSTRYLINDAAVIMNKPVVSGSIFKYNGQVTVFNYNNGPTYRCLYPTPPKNGAMLNCSETGVLGVLPGIIGSLQANEVLKMVLGIGNVLAGKLLIFDALTMEQSVLTFEKNHKLQIESLADSYETFCGLDKAIVEITVKEYNEKQAQFNLLDVRTQAERDEFHLDSFHIPLDELGDRYDEIPATKDLVIYCKSGSRSKLAIEILKQKQFKKKLFNLKGGVSGMA
ncbi:HesA/MoeB/ThiF family protein [uncultured Gelidibacter sp.]|uniref:HesA/MoeB/ThiF family protein n=1 Tax=uncultured Gelidibacter sp. TaxID=259318 RepID=UPI0026165FCE|nr:HesA/MoeB/ThiF family protein [uncultured Gelidibacter sp.]